MPETRHQKENIISAEFERLARITPPEFQLHKDAATATSSKITSQPDPKSEPQKTHPKVKNNAFPDAQNTATSELKSPITTSQNSTVSDEISEPNQPNIVENRSENMENEPQRNQGRGSNIHIP
jgi:hypothetical protein